MEKMKQLYQMHMNEMKGYHSERHDNLIRFLAEWLTGDELLSAEETINELLCEAEEIGFRAGYRCIATLLGELLK